jgi:hypothetical protein
MREKAGKSKDLPAEKVKHVVMKASRSSRFESIAPMDRSSADLELVTTPKQPIYFFQVHNKYLPAFRELE